MLAITTCLTSGIPDQKQLFRTSEEEEDKHLEESGYQLKSLITCCNRNLEISLEMQLSWNFTQSCLRNEDSRQATNCQVWHPSESTPSVGDRKSGQIKPYLALDVDFYIFICEWFHGKMVFAALRSVKSLFTHSPASGSRRALRASCSEPSTPL